MAKFDLNYTGTELNALLEKIENGEVLTAAEREKLNSIDLTLYATKTELSGKADITHTHPEYEVDADLTNFVTKEEMEEAFAKLDEKEITLATMEDFTVETTFLRSSGVEATGKNGYACTDYINIDDCGKIIVNARMGSTSNSPIVWYDSNKTYISGITLDSTGDYSTANTYEYEVPKNAVYARFSASTKSDILITALSTRDVESEEEPEIAFVAYISPNGDDANDGLTESTPIKTFNRAKQVLDPKGELIMLEGDYNKPSVDLGAFAKLTGKGNVRLIYYLDKFTEATLVDSYTNVYSVDCTTKIQTQIWQHDIPDTNTEISFEGRHPLHKDKVYRLPSTQIKDVTFFDTTSTTLEGYLNTLETTADRFLFYYDSTNSKLYFTAPSSDFVTHPIMYRYNIPIGGTPNHVHIKGINILYAQMRLSNLSGTVEDVCVLGGYAGGCFVWDNCFGMTLVRCEAAGADNDGINGHGLGQITCYDCWGHDCYDDGESSHDNCYITQYGGLYEYNGNGCTPAIGGRGDYYNVLVRNSGGEGYSAGGMGFSSQGEQATMLCNSCLAINCTNGFNTSGTATTTLINCIAQDNEIDYVDKGKVQKFNSLTTRIEQLEETQAADNETLRNLHDVVDVLCLQIGDIANFLDIINGEVI